ncbi:MAG: tRNA dihydrouridine synthase DusB [Candidatus Methylacidiphilales bacterium]
MGIVRPSESRGVQIKNLTLATPLMLSPMSGFTNLPFRVAIRSLGGLSVATTDFVNARSLIELNAKAIRMVSTCADDRPLGVQLFGGDREELSSAARFLEDLGIDFIDINLGCPSHKVTRGGAGAALMRDEELTEELLQAVVAAVHIPVTVKMRLGWDEDSMNAHIIAPRLEQMGVAAVAVHGRTREQGYTGEVNLAGIRAVVDSVRQIPVIGNGDVHTHRDARTMLEEVGCSAVMVGRAALSNPFFFRDTARYLATGQEPKEVNLQDRLAFMHLHFCLALRFWGEEKACVVFRKVIAGYSDFFPEKERWRTESQHLQSVEEYRLLIQSRVPSGLAEYAYFERAEELYYHNALKEMD